MGRYKDKKLGGILSKLYLGNYVKGEVGVITNISYQIPNESSWDIDEQLAHYIEMSVSFTLIYNNLPTYNKEGGMWNYIPNTVNTFISNKERIQKTFGGEQNPYPYPTRVK
jgi:hypothetical protein